MVIRSDYQPHPVIKTCKRCGKGKPIAEFRPKSGSMVAYQSYCRPCEKLNRAERRQKNRDSERDYLARWRTDNQSIMTEYARVSCANKRSDEKLTVDDIRWLFSRQSRCQMIDCGSTERLTVDHIMPLSAGGRNHRSNLQLLCRSCNARKATSVL